jgi:mannosyltransferase
MNRLNYHLLLWGGLLLVLLLAFGLRLQQLDAQSFWSDEGLSLYRSQQPLAGVWRNTITVDGIDTSDTNPPFYFLLLHWWQLGTGDSMFALRYLGVLLALPAIPLIYLLGQSVAGRSIGLLAALLLALSPFHIWETQILRNYGLLITLNLFSVYGLFRLTLPDQPARRRWPWLLLWLGSGLLGIYTHYFGFFIFAYGLAGLGWVGRQRWGMARLLAWRKLWWGLLLGGLLLLPVIPIALERFAAGQQIDFYPVPWSHVAHHAASAFAVGLSPTLVHPGWRVWPPVVLAGLGLIGLWRLRPGAAQLLLGYQLIPLGLLLLLSLFNPLYNGTRHLLIGLPPFLLLLATGVRGVWLRPFPLAQSRIRQGVVTLLLLIPLLANQAHHLATQFNDPALVRDDVRGVAQYLNEVVTANDIVILHDTILQFTFDYYYEGAAPVTAVPRLNEFDPVQAETRLAMLGAAAERVWFLTEPTPRTGFDRTRLNRWAAANWQPIHEKRFTALWLPLNLIGYVEPLPLSALPAETMADSIRWENGFQLHSYHIPPTAQPLTNWWISWHLSPPPGQAGAYSLLLRLYDEQGQEWAQARQEITTWPPAAAGSGLMQRHDYPVQLPAGLPPGRYRLGLRLLDGQDQRTIPLLDGGVEVALGEITVLPSQCRQPVTGYPRAVAENSRLHPDLSLRGYTALADDYRPGHLLELFLFWCAERQPRQDFGLRLQLVDSAGNVIATSEQPLSRADFPTGQWSAGQLVMGRTSLTVPGTAAAEPHALRIALIADGGQTAVPPLYRWLGRAETTLGQVNVVPWPFVAEFPPIATPYTAEWGRPPLLSLQGYELTPVGPGELLPLTLYWRGQSDAITDNHFIFVHIVDDTGEIVAQADGPPLNGFRPTSSWRQEEALVDEWGIWLPPELPPGEYDIYLGLYRPDTEERLPVFQDGVAQPNGRLWLGQFALGGEE